MGNWVSANESRQKAKDLIKGPEEAIDPVHLDLDVSTRYLVLSNISKQNNIINLCITAGAFDYAVIIVGKAHKNVEDEGYLLRVIEEHQLKVQRVKSLDVIRSQLEKVNLKLYGIEIMKTAKSVQNPETIKNMVHDGSRGFALMPGNEGCGLNVSQKRACHGFLYIPHYGDGTASLNVNVATGVVMHRLSLRTP